MYEHTLDIWGMQPTSINTCSDLSESYVAVNIAIKFINVEETKHAAEVYRTVLGAACSWDV